MTMTFSFSEPLYSKLGRVCQRGLRTKQNPAVPVAQQTSATALSREVSIAAGVSLAQK